MLNEKSIWKKFFENRVKDKTYAIQKFNNHIDTVRSTIPEERLLVFHPRDGWEPLCSFLNVEVPDTSFPNTNRGEDFSVWAKGVVNDVLS